MRKLVILCLPVSASLFSGEGAQKPKAQKMYEEKMKAIMDTSSIVTISTLERLAEELSKAKAWKCTGLDEFYSELEEAFSHDPNLTKKAISDFKANLEAANNDLIVKIRIKQFADLDLHITRQDPFSFSHTLKILNLFGIPKNSQLTGTVSHLKSLLDIIKSVQEERDFDYLNHLVPNFAQSCRIINESHGIIASAKEVLRGFTQPEFDLEGVKAILIEGIEKNEGSKKYIKHADNPEVTIKKLLSFKDLPPEDIFPQLYKDLFELGSAILEKANAIHDYHVKSMGHYPIATQAKSLMSLMKALDDTKLGVQEKLDWLSELEVCRLKLQELVRYKNQSGDSVSEKTEEIVENLREYIQMEKEELQVQKDRVIARIQALQYKKLIEKLQKEDPFDLNHMRNILHRSTVHKHEITDTLKLVRMSMISRCMADNLDENLLSKHQKSIIKNMKEYASILETLEYLQGLDDYAEDHELKDAVDRNRDNIELVRGLLNIFNNTGDLAAAKDLLPKTNKQIINPL